MASLVMLVAMNDGLAIAVRSGEAYLTKATVRIWAEHIAYWILFLGWLAAMAAPTLSHFIGALKHRLDFLAQWSSLLQ